MNAEKSFPEVEIEIIDIEEYVKMDRPIPKGKKYRIRIDNTKYVVHTNEITGSQLLELAGKVPVEQYRLYKKLKHGQSIDIEYNQVVDLSVHGVERFMTIPLDQKEGVR